MPGQISSTALVRYRLVDYSAPAAHAHKKVMVKGYVDRVEIALGAEIVARHGRSYVRGDVVYDPLHYLSLLEKKPGALDQAAPLRGWKLDPAFDTLRRLLEARFAVRAEPAKHRPVAGPGGGERFGAEHCSLQIHNSGGVQVLVGIDATDDLDVVGCRSRHVRPLVYDGWRGWLRTQPMSDTTVTGRPGPGSHQVTMSVEVGTSTGCPRVADMSGE